MDKKMKEIMEKAIQLSLNHTEEEIKKRIDTLYSETPARIKIAMAGIKMYKSLNNSIKQAGGTRFRLDHLQEMTIMDLIAALATNDIRFIYQKSLPH